MDVSRRFAVAVCALLPACTPDVAAPTGAGGSGVSSSSSSSTSTATSTSSVSVGASTTASQSVSSSSGGPASFPRCEMLFDDFDGYGSDDAFVVDGENDGPWQELPVAGAKVFWEGGALTTEAGMQKFYAALDTSLAIGSLPDCAYTVKLVAASDKVAEFGFQKPGGGEFFGVKYDPATKAITAFGGAPTVLAALPIDLAIVHSQRWYALYDDGGGWVALAPVGGADPPAGFVGPMSLGAQQNFGSATWDDFNVRGVPASLVPAAN